MSNPRAAWRRTASSAISRRLVGRVVEHLDFEQLARIVHLADGVDQPVRDVHLVEDRQLDGDARQHRAARGSGSGALSLFFM